MHPVLFSWGALTIYSYGVMVAVGFALATVLMYRRAGEFHIARDAVLDGMLIMLTSGIVGARALFVLTNMSYYAAHPLEILYLSRGGLIWYGGFVVAFIAMVLYTRRRRIPFSDFADLGAPYLALAQALGRIGCLLNGCCYGREIASSGVWGIFMPGSSSVVYPTQLYASLALLGIFVLLRLWQTHRHFAGEIFLGYCLLYALKRFVVEYWRGDNPPILLGLTMSQCMSIAIFGIAAILFTYSYFQWKKTASHLP